jgi:hypothetical protein
MSSADVNTMVGNFIETIGNLKITLPALSDEDYAEIAYGIQQMLPPDGGEALGQAAGILMQAAGPILTRCEKCREVTEDNPAGKLAHRKNCA